MYSYIRGILADMDQDQIVLDNQGIGYNIKMAFTPDMAFPTIGEEIKVYTYLNVKEDAMQLFGFMTKEDRETFKKLITVNGVGPKAGLSILSTLSSDQVKFAILGGDSKAIARAPGVGAKTAQRLVMELKDKFDLDEAFESSYEKAKAGDINQASQVRNEALEALVALGFTSSEGIRALKDLKITDDSSVEDVIGLALEKLSNL